MTAAFIFIGPSHAGVSLELPPDFIRLPPAAQGDVFRAARHRPRAIGIVDGYFEGVAAVWHKEILWALSQGVHVFGAASMGALRAAELQAFGMRGVGRIFHAFSGGELEDDDEVAVLHGPAETGFVNLSEPLVNMRATLESAIKAHAVSSATAALLIGKAKARFYPERGWDQVLADSGAAGIPADAIQRLREWLPVGRIDQKRRDALELVSNLERFLGSDPKPFQATFRFEWTDMWDMALPEMSAGRLALVDDSVSGERVLDELRLDPAAFEAVRQRTILRWLARDGAGYRPISIDPALRRGAEQRLRLRLGLVRRADVERWCNEQGLQPSEFDRLVDDEARLEQVDNECERGLAGDLLNQLRLDGSYEGYVKGARTKEAWLNAAGQDPQPADLGVMSIALLAWHFETRLQQPIPEDLSAHIRRLCLTQTADFYRLLAREWVYSQRGRVAAERE